MRGTELLDAMEHLDEDLVEEADQPPAAKKSVPFQKILTAAACLAVVAAAGHYGRLTWAATPKVAAWDTRKG